MRFGAGVAVACVAVAVGDRVAADVRVGEAFTVADALAVGDATLVTGVAADGASPSPPPATTMTAITTAARSTPAAASKSLGTRLVRSKRFFTEVPEAHIYMDPFNTG
jgi:hypothetical protein